MLTNVDVDPIPCQDSNGANSSGRCEAFHPLKPFAVPNTALDDVMRNSELSKVNMKQRCATSRS